MKVETTKDKVVFGIGVVCLIYLLNPTFGLFELIPDNIPIVGNLDEGLATSGLLACLNYFGYNFSSFFKRN